MVVFFPLLAVAPLTSALNLSSFDPPVQAKRKTTHDMIGQNLLTGIGKKEMLRKWNSLLPRCCSELQRLFVLGSPKIRHHCFIG